MEFYFSKKHNLSVLNITNKELILKIKNKSDELKIPYLERKLGKIKN